MDVMRKRSGCNREITLLFIDNPWDIMDPVVEHHESIVIEQSGDKQEN